MAGENESVLEDGEVGLAGGEPTSGAELGRKYMAGWRLHVLTFGYEPLFSFLFFFPVLVLDG